MKYPTSWSAAHNRPIVDGKIQNPETGDIEVANGPEFSGPPSVQVSWFNIHTESDLKICSASFAATMTEVLLEIMGHVNAGVYELVSVNATPYYVSVVCDIPVANEKFHLALISMQKKLDRVFVPQEEKEMYEGWEQEN